MVIAGLRRLATQGRIGPDELVVAFITGAGLKTQEAVLDALTPPLHVQPHVASFEEAIARRKEAVTAAAEIPPGEKQRD